MKLHSENYRLMISLSKTLINGEIHYSTAFPKDDDPLAREQMKHLLQWL